MRYLALLAMSCVLVFCQLSYAAGASLLKVTDSGAFAYCGVEFNLIHFGPGWAVTTQTQSLIPEKGYPKSQDGVYTLRGRLPARPTGAFGVNQTLRGPASADRVDYSVTLDSSQPVETLALALNATLPVGEFAGERIWVDGQPAQLPAALGDQVVFSRQHASRIRLVAGGRTVEVEGKDLSLMVQDDRAFGGNAFALRIDLARPAGSVSNATLNLTLSSKVVEMATLNLRAAANMGFADEVAEDGKGGWTDQGPENDLRMIPTGAQVFGGIRFDIVKPESNGGKSCVVLAGPSREAFPAEATATCETPKSLPHLYLLHATAWTPKPGVSVGQVVASYADGSSSVHEIQAGRDVGNWWGPSAVANGALAWTAETRSSYVGLYLSHIELAAKPLKSVMFRSSRAGVWMIVGVSGSETAVSLPKESPAYVVANDQWKPLVASLDVEKGSILDFSNLLDAPAGKYGHVCVRGSRFAFENAPERRARFFGVNLCFTANYPTHEEAEVIAERLARMGYNAVRFHHYDDGLVDRNAPDSVTLDKTQADKLDYFFAALKKRGIYINIDLYTFRETRANEIPEVGKPVRGGYKAAVPLLESAMRNWEAFARNLLTHTNPYTGFTWGEDPALMGICPLNEDPLATAYHEMPEIADLYEQRFADYCKTQNLHPATEAEKNAALAGFLLDLQRKSNRRTAAFLKQELKVKAPLTGVNCVDSVGLTPLRAEFDYVDNHAYWDHPGFPERPWSLPHSYNNKSVVAAMAVVPRGMFPTRIVGKPFTCTEWNYCMPNRFRGEGGVVMGAYAALQDWDGLWRFAYSHDLRNLLEVRPAAGFDVGTDPLSLLSERIAANLFLRGDVAPGKAMVPYVVTEETARKQVSGWGAGGFEEPYQLLGLCTRIGSVYSPDGRAPALPNAVVSPASRLAATLLHAIDELPKTLETRGVIPPGLVDPKARRVASDTGEIEIAGSQPSMRVSSDRTEAFVLADAGTLRGKSVSVSNDAGPAAVAVMSMDGQPVASSARLLVVHLTDVQNTKTRYRNQSMTILESWGELPHLLRAGKVTVTMAAGTGDWKLYPLEMTGKRKPAIPVSTRDGMLRISLDSGTNGAMAYELVR